MKNTRSDFWAEDYGWFYNTWREVKIGNLVFTLWRDKFKNLYIIDGGFIQIGFADDLDLITNEDFQYEGFRLIKTK